MYTQIPKVRKIKTIPNSTETLLPPFTDHEVANINNLEVKKKEYPSP